MALSTDIDETVGLWCEGDFAQDMRTIAGRRKLIQRLMVRLQTPRGRFGGTSADGKTWGWPNFGTDIAQYLNTKARPTSIASAAESECLKDEQVEDCSVTAELTNNGRTLLLTITITDSAGQFRFTLEVEQAKLTLIELQAA
jgi:hypothetical protein